MLSLLAVWYVEAIHHLQLSNQAWDPNCLSLFVFVDLQCTFLSQPHSTSMIFFSTGIYLRPGHLKQRQAIFLYWCLNNLFSSHWNNFFKCFILCPPNFLHALYGCNHRFISASMVVKHK